jgi:hypothetical protein
MLRTPVIEVVHDTFGNTELHADSTLKCVHARRNLFANSKLPNPAVYLEFPAIIAREAEYLQIGLAVTGRLNISVRQVRTAG